jgi:hypothetical protein
MFDPDRCGQFVAAGANQDFGTEVVHEVREGLGPCIERALSRVLGARLSVLQLPREGT